MNHEVVNTIEALLFGAGRPLRLSEIRSLLDNSGISEDLASIKKSINLIEERYQNTSLEIKEVSSGYRLQIKESYSTCLSSLWNEKAPRISKALMETISIIAYKQPVTRGDIEDIRGVHVSTSSIRSLLEREWIKVSGFRDVPGRPALYVTTKQFLDDFNMKSISSLPELPEPVEHNNEELLSEVV
jgi:segregation and condensation protein B